MASEKHYETFVMALAKSGADITNEMTPLQAHLLHMAVGIAGEAGELLDAVKKHVIYNKPLDLENVLEELGDLEFYLMGLRTPLSFTRDMALEHNMSKLAQRYQGLKYTDQAAQARADKDRLSACSMCGSTNGVGLHGEPDLCYTCATSGQAA